MSGRARPVAVQTRRVHGSVHALAGVVALVAAAWLGAHGGLPAVASLVWRVLWVTAVVLAAACLALVGVIALLAVVVWFIRIAEEAEK